jgi:hypothetical protein
MLAWLRRLIGTDKPSPSSALETAFLEQSRALVEICRQQHETLDRIVTARYDRPFAPKIDPQPNATMPDYMLDDQSATIGAAITAETDAEFLKMVGANG